jgi:four helix bundle protein
MKKEVFMNQTEKFPFEDTEIYKRALEFTLQCRKICSRLPKGRWSDADQLSRASLSVCNNFAEGYGRWHKNDKKQFYSIARGSAFECVPIFTFLYNEEFVSDKENDNLRSYVSEITRMLSGMIQGLEKRK